MSIPSPSFKEHLTRLINEHSVDIYLNLTDYEITCYLLTLIRNLKEVKPSDRAFMMGVPSDDHRMINYVDKQAFCDNETLCRMIYDDE